jgi:serine/threonine protein kinase/cytochrome c-type biogenesis protein CcmH/NrfG
MSPLGIFDSVRIEADVTACEQCGSTSRVGRGICLNCLLLRCLGSDSENKSTLKRLLDEIDVPDADWRIGNYQILEEIGRGGMGVIYRARQRHSRRIVALKRMLSFQADSQETLARFRREAEAAASLDHPNILPIYEVSEGEDGVPFFSMKFAPGGSLLDAASALRNEPRRSVELMTKVARAVQYAHGHGILHRDLKPGNILLDGRGEPLVSDFGLAKWLDTTSDVTRTLTIFGTPGYIAPEQARGPAKNLTAAADIYSIGAVLFDLFTGRPPFLGEHALAVIQQASEKPAPKLRSLIPGFDRDLETICAKCLEREPKARYQSCGNLAEDLERWLEGRPIKTRRVLPSTHAWRWSRRNPTIAAVIALSFAFAAALSWNIWKSEFVRSTVVTNGIAVLPFENLSPDPDNAYLADGIQEEILTRLASIAELRVISRTSTQRYQSKPRNLSQIAKQLGVANILEGSVQKATDQVRVNVQLINAQTDSHLWAETFDRKLIDIFEVQTEIARRIAESLQVKLTGREERALEVKPTNNPEAYDAYLRGLAFEAHNAIAYTPDGSVKVAGFYERAVQLDPTFAIAWARLSRADSFLYVARHSIGDDDLAAAARRDAAKRALENAQRLEPNSPETLLALGYYQHRVPPDDRAAKTTFGRVRKMLPGSSQPLKALAAIAIDGGHFDESIGYFEQALTLDPRNVELLGQAARVYLALRQFATALKLYDRTLDITPNNPDVMASKAKIYQAQGNLPEAAKLLSGISEQTPSETVFNTRISQLQFERNYGEAVRLLQARLSQFHYDSELGKALDQLNLAVLQRFAGDLAGAKVNGEQVRNILEQLRRNQPDNFYLAVFLSGAYVVTGQKDFALKEAKRAIMLRPSAKYPEHGPGLEENLALVQTMFGENSRAIATLSRLLQTPYTSWLYYPTPITPAFLRLDPLWDPLRSEPAFQELCEEKPN